MSKLKKIFIFNLIIVFFTGYIYANPDLLGGRYNLGQDRINRIVGTVTDSVTQAPLVGAKVIAVTISDRREAYTNALGQYEIRIACPTWNCRCKMFVSHTVEYNEARIAIWLPAGGPVNFKLLDIGSPVIAFVAPTPGQQILSTPTIVISYSDLGSGINLDTVKFFANSNDVSQYITEKTAQSATCVIPDSDPLPIGECVLTASVKDLAQNSNQTSITVTVINEAQVLINQGKAALVVGDILAANNYFIQALELEVGNQEANFYYALTRLGALTQTNPAIFALYQNMGYTGPGGAALTPADLNPLNFTAQEPVGLSSFELPDTFPNSEELQNVAQNIILPEFDAAFNANLAKVTEAFVSYVDTENPFTGVETIEVDYGDALMIKSLLNILKAKVYEQLVYNVGANLAQLSELFGQGALNMEYVLDNYPDLLRVKDVNSSLAARDAYVAAIDNYILASQFIHAETDDQSDDLLSFDNAGEYAEQEAYFVDQISDIKKSLLSQPDSQFSMKVSQVLNLGSSFSEPFDPRGLFDQNGMPHLLEHDFLSRVDYALGNFSHAAADYQEFLPGNMPFYTGPQKDADYSDIAAAKTILQGLRSNILTQLGYNLNFNGQDILISLVDQNNFNMNDVLSANPDLFKVADSTKFDLAKTAFSNLVSGYADTVSSLAGEIDDQSDDLIVPDDYFWDNQSRYADMLNNLNTFQNTYIDPESEVTGDEFHLNLGELFVNYKDSRPFLPLFSTEDGRMLPGAWPDPTFGGVLPDMYFWGKCSGTWGFGDYNNKRIESLAAFNNELFAGTYNDTSPLGGAQVWSATNGYDWQKRSSGGFGNANNKTVCAMAVFNGYIYAGTGNYSNGAGVWRSPDGSAWEQVNTSGFGDANNTEVRCLYVFEGKLYAGTTNITTGCELWRSDDGINWSQCNGDGFGNAANTVIYCLEAFEDYLYAGIYNNFGAQLWRSDDGSLSSWQVVNSNGFGDTSNKGVKSLRAYNGYIYAGTLKNSGGCEVWRSPDSIDWVQVNTDGFGDSYITTCSVLNTYNGKIYAGATKDTSYNRPMVYSSLDGLAWTRVSYDAFYSFQNKIGACSEFNGGLFFGTHSDSSSLPGLTVWRFVAGPGDAKQ